MLTIWNFVGLLSLGIPGVVRLVSTSAIATEVQERSALALAQDSGTAAKHTEGFAQSQAVETLLSDTASKLAETTPDDERENALIEEQPEAISQFTSVSQLSDVQPTDWAFQALQALVERYGCITGYPDSTYQGNRVLTRYEFAAGLNACLRGLNEQLENRLAQLSSEDIATLKRLQDEFATELATLRERVENLEFRTVELEARQFSPTTRLSTSIVFAASDLSGDTADGNPDTRIDSNLTLNHRTRFNFITSFTGKDRLLVRLQASDRVPNFNGVSDTNMTRLSFEVGNTNNSLRANLLEYRFPVGEKLTIYLYGNAASHHYYTTVLNPYFASFGGAKGSPSRFGDRNPIYRIGNTTGAGAAAVYRFNEALRLDVGYLAQNAEITTSGSGLFGGTYSALAQLSFKPLSNLELGLTYIRNYSADGNLTHRTGSNFSNIPFGNDIPLLSNSYGVAALWRVNPKLALSGWFGYIDARRADGIEGQADIINYAVNLAFPDLLKTGAVGGLGFGMPPKVIDNVVAYREDTGTGLHFEAFYEYPLTDNIKVIPGIIYLTNPEHNNTNSNIFIGTVRTVFNF
ncbi:MAG: iron uptake porin [Coleofasciculus sp. S288]|nr:iron uptake porin [Coleofasciculus sp. S288]